MSDKNKLKEKKVLKELARYYVNNLEDVFDGYNREGNNFKFSNEESFITKYRKIKRQNFFRRKVLPLVSMFVLTCVIVGCFKPISRFFVEIYEKFADIEFFTSDNEFDFEEVGFNFIPEGFELIDEISDYEIKFFNFLNKETNKKFSVMIESSMSIKGIDVEDAGHESDTQSLISEKDGYVALVVTTKNIIIEIFGEISKQDAIKIIDEMKGIN